MPERCKTRWPRTCRSTIELCAKDPAGSWSASVSDRPSRPGPRCWIRRLMEGALSCRPRPSTPPTPGLTDPDSTTPFCVVDDTGRRIDETTLPHSRSGLAKDHHPAAPPSRDPCRDRTRRRPGRRTPHPRWLRGSRHRRPAGEVATRPHGAAGNKDDRFDALVLADALRTDADRWATVQPDSDETVGLRMPVRARHDLIDHRITVHNQLPAVLQPNFPARSASSTSSTFRSAWRSGAEYPPKPKPLASANCGGRTGSRPIITAAATPPGGVQQRGLRRSPVSVSARK